jgi:hypothetical protein
MTGRARSCVGCLYSLFFLSLLLALPAASQTPYFVTYSHYLEEPGNLEVSLLPTIGLPKTGPRFASALLELEYGLTAWWTTEFYLDGQTTAGQSTLFTGWRWENRFRPLAREHWINPVLYVEYERLNGADKTLREVVGFDAGREQAETPNDLARQETEHEVELRLILSSSTHGWNLAENFLAVKNLSGEPWEFGYAVGISRPLALEASPQSCHWCRENFTAGIELYGGLGSRERLTLSGTSHYIGPILSWTPEPGWSLRFSPSFGLTREAHRLLLRFGLAYELTDLWGRLRGRR